MNPKYEQDHGTMFTVSSDGQIGTFKIAPPPKAVGRWEHRTGFEGSMGVASLQLYMYRKPSWITRYLMKHLMEIHWVDAQP
jgi:hypothetical protein